MKNTKEVQTILSVLYYYNRLSETENADIRNLLDYAFYRLFDSNTNMLMLACLGKNIEDARGEIEEILKNDTEYFAYIERKNAIRGITQ